MYIFLDYYVHMKRRTTIEIDDDLLAQAKRVTGEATTRATVEEALRRVVNASAAAGEDRTRRQSEFFATLADHADLDVLASEDMWR